jgi:DNA-binding IclR family transcriptional regulator
MEEQTVRHNEQPLQEPASTPTPAPMVERAFKVLDLLSLSEEGLTLSEMARTLDMSKSSMHGLLKTLEARGVVEQSEERLYTLGPHIYDLAQAYIRHSVLRRLAIPAMQRLAEKSGETVLLGRVEHNHVRIIESVEAKSDTLHLHISAARGTRVPLLAGALGRLVLASWSVAEREEFVYSRPLPRFTANSIADPRQFLAAVAEAEQTGIGIDSEEYLTGVNAVAVPIVGSGKALIALLWVVGFASRFSTEAMQQIAQQLQIEAMQISQLLGARSPS